MRNPFRKRHPAIRASINEIAICEISRGPSEKRIVCKLAQPAAVLQLEDADNKVYRYDLASAVREGFCWAHVSVRVSEDFACQSDAILSKSNDDPQERFRSGTACGIRFQPFYLPGCKRSNSELAGRGLFYRGFHFGGSVTPGNVSLSCICDLCESSFRIQSFHSGLSGDAYFYCSKGLHTLVVSDLASGARTTVEKSRPESLTDLEARLPPCDHCGGTFAYLNPFRCPDCAAPYIDFRRFPADRETEYYGNHLYGEALQRFKPV
jgi:hypothetical protein